MARKSKKDQAKADVETVEEIVKDVVEATETEAEAVVEDISEETLDAVDDHADDAPTEETPEHDYDDHHDDAHHGSFSSKVLTGLVLLGVGGGAALWGGPNLRRCCLQAWPPFRIFRARTRRRDNPSGCAGNQVRRPLCSP